MKAECPVDAHPGKPVKTVTVEHMVHAQLQASVAGQDWFFCSSPTCSVVYFSSDGTTLRREDVRVRVGIKEEAPPHLVCYCFGHSTESIRAEIERTGESTVLADVTARIKAGECQCELLNPKGVCCLGDLGAAVKDVLGTNPRPAPSGPDADCCKE